MFGLTRNQCNDKAKDVLNKNLNDPLKLGIKQTDCCCFSSCFVSLLPDVCIFPEFERKTLTANLFPLNTANTIL